MQLTNEPAEELARFLIDESNGAFASCGFVCGGDPSSPFPEPILDHFALL